MSQGWESPVVRGVAVTYLKPVAPHAVAGWQFRSATRVLLFPRLECSLVHGKTCPYVRREVLGDPYTSGFQPEESVIKATKDRLKKPNFWKRVHRVLTTDPAPKSVNATASVYGDSPQG